ncbi:hypothetical protein PHET_09492 [Paragonimus heterotremus]|uniref:Uncharacterized protein n=1 Tax=Paragonimus heterotremus TaxID=100268 RepID=A0A8J4SVH4_9TREM|nr:hypothetical protein PHET_09492 [Paragonimus heterotremus]
MGSDDSDSTSDESEMSLINIQPNSSKNGAARTLSQIYLPNIPQFSAIPISPLFRKFHYISCNSTLKGALKSAIFNHTSEAGLFCGTIGERTSFKMLKDSNFVDWLRSKNYPPIVFHSLHSQTFNDVSSGRIRMTVDLYIDQFLPRLAAALRRDTRLVKIDTGMIVEALLLPVFQIEKTNACKSATRILVDFTSVNRGFFVRRHHSARE